MHRLSHVESCWVILCNFALSHPLAIWPSDAIGYRLLEKPPAVALQLVVPGNSPGNDL